MKILITGATGFIGKAIIPELLEKNHQLVAAVRAGSNTFTRNMAQINVGELLPTTYWFNALNNVDVVIHLAARVHIMNDDVSDPLTEFRKVNTEATLSLARQAEEAGVKRFIYLSSIGVNGKNTSRPYTEQDNPLPHNDYALTKYEAELGLLAWAKKTGLEVVIIRPPLVYGPDSPGNFLSLIKWANKPLPFGAIHNQRSFIALDNLVSFTVQCLDHPKAANEIFLIADGNDISTTELLRKVTQALGKKSWLFPVPVCLMMFAAKLIGKANVADKLFNSLQVDSSKARNLLGWKPVITMDQQLKKTADAYLENEKTL